MRLRVALVDDNDILRMHIEELVRKNIPENQLELMAYTKGESLLFNIEEGKDIYILDVEMPGINGIDLAKEIREKDKKCEIIFLTAYAKYALQGYETHAYSYILKDEMDTKLPKILRQINKKYTIARDNIILLKRIAVLKKSQ